MRRTVFFISGRTGITAETLGHGLLSQFEGMEFEQVPLPYVDTPERAVAACRRIDAAAERDGVPPIVFSALADPVIRDRVRRARGVFFDVFDTFIRPLERELGVRALSAPGRSHGLVDYQAYMARVDAINYVQMGDEADPRHLDRADVVLLGVSRSGKTPACVYLALQFGIRAANRTLTEAELEAQRLPAGLEPYRDRLFGLTVRPERLAEIRAGRAPGSPYADAERCRREVEAAETLFCNEGIPCLDVTCMSVEEIASTVIEARGLRRRLY
ncbi:pyruvate, water dikinase regulatory protein [Inmirania thermothiophila]|uniref:Putative phosphoenolpyruvate synthase regulatory protein n=1 Tax=Inmirania thermothiophila TaxID=1750597 RepID=A0A3N1Y6Z3_9GAMM|nr:pyruvate, water dikinase regulatory protein [Inmirania thermothiophila]ROR34594.1 hypothetical protein EDC57_0492 [Inmirania thermothiophila]